MGGKEMKTKSKLSWCFLGDEENTIISLEKWSRGNSSKCLAGSRNICEADIKQTRPRYY